MIFCFIGPFAYAVGWPTDTATLGVELIARAAHLDDGVNQPVPRLRQGSRREDSHLTLLNALARMVQLPVPALRRDLTGQRLHTLQPLRLVALHLHDEVIARSLGHFE